MKKGKEMQYLMRINKTEYKIKESLYEKIKDLKKKGTTEVLLNGKNYKLSEIDITIDVLDGELDFSTVNDTPKDEFIVSNASVMDQIKGDIRSMLKQMKERDADGLPKPKYKDEKHALAVADVWEHLKGTLNEIKCPVIDLNWKLDKSIISHSQGRESHPVSYYTKTIDLGDNYDKYFWCEAGYIKCEACNKVIKHEIRLGNDYECEVIVRSLIRKEA